jgi:hypothetical protein
MGSKTQERAENNDSGSFDIDQFRMKPAKTRRTTNESVNEEKPVERDRLSKRMASVMGEMRKAFDAISAVGEEGESFLEASSEYTLEESGDRDNDLELVTFEVQFLVDSILEHEEIGTAEKNKRLEEIKAIEEKMEDLSWRYQSDERDVRGAQPHAQYGYLEPAIQKVYDQISTALRGMKRYLGSL